MKILFWSKKIAKKNVARNGVNFENDQCKCYVICNGFEKLKTKIGD
jgi:hypothetical protein